MSSDVPMYPDPRGRKPGTRVAGSLPMRLQKFFTDNPGEELTYADICAKFGTTAKNAHNAVAHLSAAGAVESLHVVRLPAKGRAS